MPNNQRSRLYCFSLLLCPGHHHDYQRTCPVFNQTCVSASATEHSADADDDETLLLDMGSDETDAETDAASPAFGTVHITSGAAGQWCNTGLFPSPLSWLEFANDESHGYNRVKVRGDQATVEFVAAADRSVVDSVTIRRGGRALGRPPRVTRNPSRSWPQTRNAKRHARRARQHPPQRRAGIELMSAHNKMPQQLLRSLDLARDVV